MGFTQQQTPTTGVNTEERRFGEFRTAQSSNNQKGGYIKVKKQKFFSRNIVIALALIALLAGGVLYAVKPAEAKAHTHSYRWVVKKAASCTSEGYRNYECACGSCINSQTIPRTPHTYDRSSPTCTAARKCIYCGYVIQGALGHRWNRTTANCTASKSCTRCGVVAEPARGHSMQWVCTTPATCTTNGQKVNRCATCGYVGQTETIPCYGHHFAIPSATCTEDRRCTSCGYVIQGALGHNWNRNAATCTEDKKCTRCGKIDQKATGHVGTHWVVVQEPTCYYGGKEEYKCACEQHSTNGRDIPATGKHNWVEDHTEPGNCIAWGYTYYRCSNDGCKATKKEANIPPTAHTYRWVVTTQPTKNAVGVESYMCSYCDAVEKTRNLYLISYNANGGNSASIPANQTKTAGVSIKLSSKKPTREGYIFKGWSTNKTDVNYQPGDTYTKNAKLNLYAIWEQYGYRVEYNANGGSEAPATQYKQPGVPLTLSDMELQKTGYDFIGWSRKSDATVATWSIGGSYEWDEDILLYAVWVPKKYKVKYVLNGGKVTDSKKFEEKTYKHGTTVQINTESPRKVGYRFKGWTTSKNSTTVKYGPGREITLTGNVTLYAIWEKMADCKIVFHFPDPDTTTKNEVKYYTEEKYYAYDTEINMPEGKYCIPGKDRIVWHADSVTGSLTWNDGEAYIVLKNIEFYGTTRRDDDKKRTHDFTGYTQVTGLKDESFIASETPGDSNDYGFNQGFFGDKANYHYAEYHSADLAWEMFITRYPFMEDTVRDELRANNGLKDYLFHHLMPLKYNQLMSFLTEKYPDTYQLGEIVVNNIEKVTFTELFAAIDNLFGDDGATSRLIKEYYGAEYQKFIEGSCGIYAAVNTYLYLSGNNHIFTVDSVQELLKEYLRMTGSTQDWIERNWSHGDGIVSICKFLQNKLSSRGCNAIWWDVEDAVASTLDMYACYNKIKSILKQDIPVIMALYREDGARLRFYYQNGNTLTQGGWADEHYWVVTGVYENPDCPDKHFLEVSTWGRKMYICYEEFFYGREGKTTFSTIMDIKFKK